MLPAFFMPMLIGAGTGALGGLLTGKDPLKGALIGGATGGLLSSIPAIGAAGAGTGGAKVAIGDIASSTALPTALQGSSLATGGAGLGSTVGSNAGINFGANLASTSPYAGFSSGITNELGANMAFNPSSGLGMPDVSSAIGKGSIDNLAQYSTGAGTDIMAKNPSMFDQLSENISPYLNVRDLSGAAQVASQFQPRPQQIQPQSGNVTRGQAPQGTDVMALLQSIKQPERRRITLL